MGALLVISSNYLFLYIGKVVRDIVQTGAEIRPFTCDLSYEPMCAHERTLRSGTFRGSVSQ